MCYLNEKLFIPEYPYTVSIRTFAFYQADDHKLQGNIKTFRHNKEIKCCKKMIAQP